MKYSYEKGRIVQTVEARATEKHFQGAEICPKQRIFFPLEQRKLKKCVHQDFGIAWINNC